MHYKNFKINENNNNNNNNNNLITIIIIVVLQGFVDFWEGDMIITRSTPRKQSLVKICFMSNNLNVTKYHLMVVLVDMACKA